MRRVLLILIIAASTPSAGDAQIVLDCTCVSESVMLLSETQQSNCPDVQPTITQLWKVCGVPQLPLQAHGDCAFNGFPCWPDLGVATVSPDGANCRFDLAHTNKTYDQFVLICVSNGESRLTAYCPLCTGGGEGECEPPPGGCVDGQWVEETCSCGPTPILVSEGGNRLSLTSLQNGVRFDLDSDGIAEKLSWTQPGAADAFLVLDRNGNGTIDDGTELFGDATPQPPSSQPNGYLALAEFDLTENGGNEDGSISAADAVFDRLGFWFDWNHNGISEPNELQKVSGTRVRSFHLEYRESRRQDQYGNTFRYVSMVEMQRDAPGPRKSFAVDVFLLREP